MSTMNRWARIGLALPLLTIVAFVVVEAQHVRFKTTIGNVDYFPIVDRGLGLNFSSWDAWVNSKQAFGHSGLVRLGLELGWDAARVGEALSILGGVLLLLGTFLLALSVFRDKRYATLVLAFTAASSVVLLYSGIEGNDMLAAGLQILSLGVLAASTLKERGSHRLVWAAGLIAGLAYLIRYNGMITAMAGALWLVIMAVFSRRLADWKLIASFGLGFLIGSALQWIPSLIVTHNPFYTDQGLNVWGLVNDQFDILRGWQQAPPGITVFQVFANDPKRFVGHWWFWFKSFWADPELLLLDVPLKFFGQAGMAFLLLAPGPASGKSRSLLGLFALAHLASISMMKLTDRYLIMMVPLLALGAAYLLTAIIPPRWEFRQHVMPLSLLVLAVGLAWAARVPLDFAIHPTPPDTTAIRASNVLHAAGMRSAAEVLSTHLKLQDTSSLARLRFIQAHAVTPEFESVGELIQSMRSNHWRFFIYHRDYGAQTYPGLRDQLYPFQCPAEMLPIYVHENNNFVVCRLNEASDGYTTFDARLENGITLEGYELHTSRDFPEGAGQSLGIYLHWRAQAKIDNSYKVFVHLLDANGRPVAQDDGVPALWTHGTDEWKSDELVIDFHMAHINQDVPPGDYALQVGMYNDGTGVRVKRVDAEGNPIADTIMLSKLSLSK